MSSRTRPNEEQREHRNSRQRALRSKMTLADKGERNRKDRERRKKHSEQQKVLDRERQHRDYVKRSSRGDWRVGENEKRARDTEVLKAYVVRQRLHGITGLASSFITDDMVQAKREVILVKRKLKELKGRADYGEAKFG